MKLQLKNIAHLFKNARIRSIILLTGCILLFGLLYGVVHFANKKEPVADSSVQLKDSPGDIQSIPGGLKQPPSIDYQRLQARQNLQQAEIAEKTGASTIPTLLDSNQFEQNQQQLLGINNCSSPCNSCWNEACAKINSARAGMQSGAAVVASLQPSQLKSGTLVYGTHRNVIGHLGADGKVRDDNGQVIGQVGPDGLVRSADGSVIGSAAVPAVGDAVYDAAGLLIGTVGKDGKVRDIAGHVVGTVGLDGTVRNSQGAIIGKVANSKAANGRAIPGTPAYDNQGKLLGTVGSDKQIRDVNGAIVARVGDDSLVKSLHGEVIGKLGATAPGIPVYDKQGNLVGTVGSDNIVRDAQGKALGRLGAGGIVRDAQGNEIGSTTAPLPRKDDILAATSSSDSNNLVTPGSSAAAVSLLSGTSDNPNPELQSILDRQTQQISAQKAEQLQQQIQSSMSTQAGQLFAAWAPPSQQYVAGTPSTDKFGGMGGEGTMLSAGLANTGAPPAVKAGTIMYAVLLTSVNSDEPGPVLAEIVEGKFKGARLLGTLSNQGKKVLLAFNTLTLPKLSSSIAINTVGIDESTARTALSSYTNNHYWLRYGTLFASAFIQGYGQSFVNAGANYAGAIIINPDNRPIDLKPRDRLFVGLGQVGLKYSQVLSSIFTTPPTVHVYSGTPMGILFLSDLAALPSS